MAKFSNANKKIEKEIENAIIELSKMSKNPIEEFGLKRMIDEQADIIGNEFESETLNVGAVDTGEFFDGIYVHKGTTNLRNYYEAQVGDEGPHEELIWLIEYGHVTRNGVYVPARPVLMPAYRKAIGEFDKLLEKELEHHDPFKE
jgi:hypothetical protein